MASSRIGEWLTNILEGSVRICIERLIATLSHSSAASMISDDHLLSLLRIGSGACRPVKTMDQIRSEADQYLYIENAFGLYRKPMFAVFTEDDVDSPLQVAEEPAMGPTTQARLLTLLSQRGLLPKINKLTKLPPAISSRTTLAQFKQIVSPDAIQRGLVLAKQRLTKRRELGHKRFRIDGEIDFAMQAYSTAAELAVSLIMFDHVADGGYKNQLEGVRRELVLCLGNAAEMGLGHEKYERALYYALAAVEYAENLPLDADADAVDATIREKNRRRVVRARDALK